MINKSGKVKIMDFGLAKIKGGTELTKIGTTLGTTAYMSPEQARGEEIDNRTDIWSLGVVLFEMLTGELPFKGDYEQAVIYSLLNDEPMLIKELREDTPSQLIHIVDKTLQKNPINRYQDMTEVLSDLLNLQSNQPSDFVDEAPENSIVAVLPFSNCTTYWNSKTIHRNTFWWQLYFFFNGRGL